jgi:hypothetical protein
LRELGRGEPKPFLERDAEGLKSRRFTRAHCRAGVIAAFPCKLLKNGSRASSVGTEDVQQRAEKKSAFPRCVISQPEQLLNARLSVEKGGCLASLSESIRISGRPHGREQERATLARLRKARYYSDVKRRRHQPIPAPSHASHDATLRLAGRSWLGLPCVSGSKPRFSRSLRKFASRRGPRSACMREPCLWPRDSTDMSIMSSCVCVLIHAHYKEFYFLVQLSE